MPKGMNRKEKCHGILEPIGVEITNKKGYVIVYKCKKFSAFCIYYFLDIIYNNVTMGRTIKRIKTLSFIIILLEILAGAAFSVVYFNDFFNLQARLTPYMITLAFIAALVVNCMFVWIVILVLSSRC